MVMAGTHNPADQPVPISPSRLLSLCLDYVCNNFDKYASQIPKVNKELKDKLWKFALMEHLIDDSRLPLFFDTYYSRDVDLTGCDRITDNSLLFISKKCGQLQSVNLSFCINVTADGIKTLATNCTTLTALFLCHCSVGDPALLIISSHLQGLKTLALSGCMNITDAGVQKVAQKCQDLQYLDISHCKTLTSNSIKAIASSLSNLVHLDLSWCSDSVSEGSIQKLSKLHKLQHLGIADSKVTDSILYKILSSCPKLVSLDIAFCNGILQADKPLKYFNNLTRLNIAGCAVSEPTLSRIIEVAGDLRDLDVSYNDQLKEQWVTLLVNNPQLGKQLKSLNVGFCKNITFKLAQQLQQARDSATIYYFGGAQ